MTTVNLILALAGIWFVLSIVAAIGIGKVFKAGSDDDQFEAALEGDLSNYVQSLKREAAE